MDVPTASHGTLRTAPAVKPTPKQAAQFSGSKRTATVFVRVRPALEFLGEAGDEILPGLRTSSAGQGCVREQQLRQQSEQPRRDAPDATAGVAAMLNSGNMREIGGFTGVCGMGEGNEIVFERTFRQCVPTVLRGGTAALFCYGYTGAGKTHTVFGVESDRGMYHRAATELLRLIAAQNAAAGDAGRPGGPLRLHASVVEVYNDGVFDLLGDRKKVALRTNGAGQLCARGETVKCELDAATAAAKGAEFAVTTEGLRTVEITSEAHLDDMYRISKAHRAVGSSSLHDQSSRSHAIFRLEVVDAPLLAAREELEEAESIKPGVQSAFAKTPKLEIKKRLAAIEATIERCTKAVDSMVGPKAEAARASLSAVGGTLILVDLAGADSDARDVSAAAGGTFAEERKESQAINKSLLALKECLRGLHAAHVRGVAPGKLPFRDSSVTRLLEEVLMPQPGRDSDTVMLVNVAPPARLERKTVNSLRYGQLYAVASADGAGSAGSAGSASRPARPARAPPPASDPAAEPCDPALLQTLRAMYQEHAPEKTRDEVEKILRSFSGREAELLEKVRAKYALPLPGGGGAVPQRRLAQPLPDMAALGARMSDRFQMAVDEGSSAEPRDVTFSELLACGLVDGCAPSDRLMIMANEVAVRVMGDLVGSYDEASVDTAVRELAGLHGLGNDAGLRARAKQMVAAIVAHRAAATDFA